MRFEMLDQIYSLVFHHTLPDTVEKMGKRLHPRDAYGNTEAILYRVTPATENTLLVKEEISRGHAICGLSDTYVKSVGRKVATKRLFKKAQLSWMKHRVHRQTFWMIYFAKTADMSEEMYVKNYGCPKTSYAYSGIKKKED